MSNTVPLKQVPHCVYRAGIDGSMEFIEFNWWRRHRCGSLWNVIDLRFFSRVVCSLGDSIVVITVVLTLSGG
jgi:hypothetical protein